MNKAISIILLLFLIGGTPDCESLFITKAQQRSTHNSLNTQHNLRIFEFVWKLIYEKYYDSKFNNVNWVETKNIYRSQIVLAQNEHELYELINKMLDALQDKHTFAISPQEVKKEKLKKRIGIGISGKIINKSFVITKVFGGSPAQNAGIKSGWLLTEWNDLPFDPKTFGTYELHEGQLIKMKFLDIQNRIKRLALECHSYNYLPEQRSQILDGGILYIRFDQFDKNIREWFSEIVEQNIQAPAFIIDLRNNSGGEIETLKECLEQLYTKEQFLGEFIQRKGKHIFLEVDGDKYAYKNPIIVLLDEESSSAAEIFAAAIQESKRGIIVGRKSTGAVLASIEEQLPDGGKLQISIRNYITRQKQRLEGIGVTPDELIPLTIDNLRKNIDLDVKQALKIIQTRKFYKRELRFGESFFIE